MNVDSAIEKLRHYTNPTAKITERTVWSNGKTVRNYRGQDKPGAYVANRSAAKGYRRMTMLLIDEEVAE